MSLARLMRSIELPQPDATAPVVTPGRPVASANGLLATIHPSPAVQAAQHAVEGAREAHNAAAADLRALLGQRGTRDSVDGAVLAAAGAAEEQTKAALRARKAELRTAIETWTPALRRLLAPHRAEAASRIVAAVGEIEDALARLGPLDSFVAKWAVEPHPLLHMHDLRAMRHSAERIVAVGEG